MDTETVKNLQESAEQGIPGDQFNLGLMYYQGQGVPQNYSEAVKWYRKAAEQGITGAQFNLGLMYALGEGVPQSYVSAHTWANLAAVQGMEEAIKLRNLLQSRMTREQVAKAQKLAADLFARIMDHALVAALKNSLRERTRSQDDCEDPPP